MTRISAPIRQMEKQALCDGKITKTEAAAMLNAAKGPDEKKAVREMLAKDGYDPAHHAKKPTAQGTGQKPAPKQGPLGYDEGEYDVKPMKAGETRADADSDVLSTTSQPYEIKGAKTDEEYIVAAHAIAHLAQNPDAWNKEADIQVKVNGKLRHVTVKLNDTNKIEAEIAPDAKSAQWEPKKHFKTMEEGVKALKKDFGVDVVTKRQALDTNWSSTSKDFKPDELEKIYDAMSKMTPEELAGIKGVKLARVDGFKGSTDKAAAEFENGTKPIKGTNRFERDDRIAFGDSAFASDPRKSVGGLTDVAPWSEANFHHEVGHALETTELRKAELDEANAPAVAGAAMQAPWKSLTKELSNFKTDDANDDAFNTAADAAKDAMDAVVRNDDPTQSASLRKAAADALKAVTALQGKVTPGQQKSAGAVMKALNDISGIASRRADALEALDKADGSNGSESTKLESFMKMIDQNKLAPFTKYAADSVADGKNEEFFAEAYMLYKADPDYLKANQPRVFEWMKDNVK